MKPFPLASLMVVLTVITAYGCVVAADKAPFKPGTVTTVEIPSPSLAKALLPAGKKQSMAVYLPPSYKGSKKRYPVVYYMHGYGGSFSMELDNVASILDSLYASKTMKKEVIVVAPNGANPLGGAFFVNSPVLGDWEDYVIKDVVGYVDGKFRTVRKPGGRAIIGFSMGGFAALNLGMRHPETFCAAYGLSPGVFNEKGLDESQMFSDPFAIEGFIDGLESLRGQTAKEAKVAYELGVTGLDNFTLAYGSAFAPDQKGKVPYIRYPYTRKGTKPIKDPMAYGMWFDGFGGWDWKTDKYSKNLKSLRLYGFDAGIDDQYAWIPKGCAYLDKLLKRKGIPHFYASYQGDHGNMLGERLEGTVFPKLDKVLD